MALPTVRARQDINRVLAAAQFALHVEVRAVRIARVRIGRLVLGQIVPFVRLLAAVAALDFDEERVARVASA